MSATEWAVAWEVASLPPEVVPAAPVPPVPPSDPDDTEAAQAYAQAQQDYQVAVDMVYHDINTLLANDEYWQDTLSLFADEAEARAMLPRLISANASNQFTRNFRVVYSAPRVWTPA
ncbi:hypothetical protein [Mycolicibacterium conceptionense]|uniref:hypothetical protein n=1 Tax=Mycolicibacterium conceptionense TaxID=451644 RepID=UPI00096F8DB9|nr:hypothetical protein [Mycolicibacterium conceptionense]OMB79312.1 hypothetical protein A5743_14445 [Mycolicibacterium conceptionense]